MKKLMTAVALTIALPAAALAQADPHAGHNMAASSRQANTDCKAMDHSKMDHSKMAANHAGMDHSKMDHSKMSGMKGMEHCAKPAATADKAKPSSTPKR
jgi:copper resistance protein B